MNTFPLLRFITCDASTRRNYLPLASTLLMAVALSAGAASAQTWSGPSFREYCGDNQAPATEPLYINTLSWNRRDISWESLQPTNYSTNPPTVGAWNLTKLTAMQQEAQTLAAKNVRLLPILDYCAIWAIDRSSRTWVYGNDKFTVTPGSGWSMNYNHYNNSTGALISSVNYPTGTDEGKGYLQKFPPAASHAVDWTAYVQKVVTTLRPTVEYFQVWNEAFDTTKNFWYGTLDDYVVRVLIPAAQVIHNAGGKVVYGGFPYVGTVQPLIDALDAANAWGVIDVIDTHYYGTEAYDQLRTALDARGHTGMAIWQTENGYTTDNAYIPTSYTKRIYWALQHNWTQDRYKAFYFANSDTGSSSDPSYHHCLYSGSTLYSHGQCLQALGNLLGNTAVLNVYPGVTSTPAFSDVYSAASTMESFAVGNTVVLAVNLSASDYSSLSTVSFNLPINRATITKAERVDIIGTRTDISNKLSASGSSTNLTGVAVKDPSGSSARTWNDAAGVSRVFYVAVTLNGPAVQKFETENLAVAAQSSGVTHRVGADNSFSNDAGTYLDATAAGQYVTYTLSSVPAGNYEIFVGVKNLNSRGIWQVAASRLDMLGSPTNVGLPYDQYSATQIFTMADIGLWNPTMAGDKAIRFVITGKNAASSGYSASFDSITLVRR